MWVELLGIAAGLIALISVVVVLTPQPKAATWHDLPTPQRVTRGEHAALTIEIAILGSSVWVNAVGTRRQSVRPILEWTIDTSTRGKFAVGPTHLEFSDLFGVRSKILATRELTQVTVVPQVRPFGTQIDMSPVDHGILDEGPGYEHFHSIREYVPGDPMRMVHWRSSARMGQLMVRRLVDTTVPTLLVVLDLDARSYNRTASEFSDFDFAEFEAAVDLTASCVLAHCNPSQRVLMTTTNSGDALADISLWDRHEVLDRLAIVHPSSSTLPGRVQEIVKTRGLGHVALITGKSSVLADHAGAWSRLARVTTLRP